MPYRREALLVYVTIWAVIAIALIAAWHFEERRRDPVARIATEVARDERRIRKMISADRTDQQILDRYPGLQPHHIDAARLRLMHSTPNARAVERSIYRLRRRPLPGPPEEHL